MSKYHLILVLLILQAWVTKADDTERELLLKKDLTGITMKKPKN